MEVLNFAVMAEGATAEEFAASSGPAASTATHHAPAATTPAAPAPYGHPAAPIPAPLPMASPGKRAVNREASSSGSGAGAGPSGSGSGGDVVYPRGPISGIPEAYASRRERFAELEGLQAGWQVELRAKGDTVEAVFFAPGSGECVGAYANARRMALAAAKAAKAAA